MGPRRIVFYFFSTSLKSLARAVSLSGLDDLGGHVGVSAGAEVNVAAAVSSAVFF
jgi:hypothetical protein